MCLIAWRWQPVAATPLILLANRDEFYARATQPLRRWDGSSIWAGRDLEGGGTWLGVTASGRLAALTNYRDPAMMRNGTPSRGDLVRGFLESELSAADFLRALADKSAAYNPFNLLLFDGAELWAFEGRGPTHQQFQLAPGVDSVSNAGFGSPWPKMSWLRGALAEQLTQDGVADDALLTLLLNNDTAPDALLPQTGIPLDKERALSAPFIRLPDYGTRACSLIRLGGQSIRFVERTFDANGFTGETVADIARL